MAVENYFELFSVLIFALTVGWYLFAHKDARAVAIIFSGAAFGLVLEYGMVRVFEAYWYSRAFWIQIGDFPGNIPVCIALSWGVILYACIRIASSTKAGPVARPFVAAFLALAVDIVMDPLAIRLGEGFWVWEGIPLEPIVSLNSFFGVAYGNFFGWFTVALIFASLVGLEERFISVKKEAPLWKILFFYVFAPIAGFSVLMGVFFSVGFILDLTFALPFDGSLAMEIPAWANLALLLIALISAAAITVFSKRIDTPEPNDQKYTFSVITLVVYQQSMLAEFVFSGRVQDAPLIGVLAFGFLVVDAVFFTLTKNIRAQASKNHTV